MAEENAGIYFSVDESMFGHSDGAQTWLFGIVNNSNNEEFRLDFTENRDTDSIKSFISKTCKKR